MAYDFSALVKVNKQISDDIKRELHLQGHTLTGELEKSIKPITSYSLNNTIVLEAYAKWYVIYTEDGVPSEKIPYNPDVKTGAKTSKYIQALIGYFIKRGLSAKEAKSAAFATARKHKQEGMSTKASVRFSKTGKRQGAIRDVIFKNELKYSEMIEKAIDQTMESVFNELKSEVA